MGHQPTPLSNSMGPQTHLTGPGAAAGHPSGNKQAMGGVG